ncbi:MAG: NHL repeat-containing protein [Terracidiphilus sp.]
MRISWTIVLATCVLMISGCSGVPGTSPNQTSGSSVPGAALHGMVHGGQQPIVGAHVYLYAANTTGYGNAAVSLLQNVGGTVSDGHGNYYYPTGSGGTFSITNDFTCPSAGSQVYLYAIGGDPGLGDGANAAIGLMAALGTCGSLSSAPYVVINEISTIATAYSIAGFATDSTHVSSSSSPLATATDVPNAFATVTNLESLGRGVALPTTPDGNGVVPQATIDTLADILGACVNSAGPTSTPCTTLFANATNGNSQPLETATAAINIAHNPGANTATLYGLLPTDLPFQPTLLFQPNDFTIAITYAGGGLDGTGLSPQGVAIDTSGNVWVPNFTTSSLSEFNSNGVPKNGSPFSAAGLDNPTSVAIDLYGSAWVANYNGNDLSEFNSQGQKISGPPGFTGGGLNEPYGIAIDSVGNAWAANFGGNSLSEFESNASGGLALSSSSGYGSDVLAEPAGVAADINGNVWTANYGEAGSPIAEAVPSNLPGQPPTVTLYKGGGLNSPYGIAIDGAGNVWAANRGGSGSVSEFSTSGTTPTAISGTGGFSGGGLDNPYGIAIDGAGNVWAANSGGNANSISEISAAGVAISGANGFVNVGMFSPYGIAVDGSGNVWVASDDDVGPLTEFVGVAAPVVTPIAAGTSYMELGTRP